MSVEDIRPARERRVPLNVRIGPRGKVWLLDLSVEEKVDLSTVVRAALAVARRHEPELKATIRKDQP